MEQSIKQIEMALIDIDALDEESKKALDELHDVIAVIEDHPIKADFRDKLAGAANQITTIRDRENDGESHPPSKLLSAIESYLSEAVSDHPRLALAVGRLANALSVAGL